MITLARETMPRHFVAATMQITILKSLPIAMTPAQAEEEMLTTILKAEQTVNAKLDARFHVHDLKMQLKPKAAPLPIGTTGKAVAPTAEPRKGAAIL